MHTRLTEKFPKEKPKEKKKHRGRKENRGEFHQKSQTTVRTGIIKFSEPRPHKCQECDKSFGRREHLRRHYRKHRGLQPYQCHQCKKGFKTKAQLIRHQSSSGDTSVPGETVTKFLEMFSCTSKRVNHLKMPWPHIQGKRQ